MKKICLFLLLALLVFACAPAMADSYALADIYMAVTLPNDKYPVQLTKENLAANQAYIESRGETLEGMQKKFADEGIVLMAFDDSNDRVFVITAVQDDPARELYDINEQTANTRASYRANHSNGTYCSHLGYKFESCEWKNFGDGQGRFLMLKYILRENGEVAHRGLWRRTIRNGYTITMDMQVYGRQVKSGDITALNKIQDTVSFLQVSNAPDAPLSLVFTAPPPEITNESSFTIKGTTRAGATVIAAYASLRSSQSKAFTTEADANGNFKINITLPASDLYNMIVSAIANEGMENEEELSQEFQIEYNPSLLQVSFTSPIPEQFTSDTFKFTGTTMTGVTVQLDVNGKVTTRQTGNNRTFSFSIDTSKAGTYNIYVSFTKKNYDTRVFNYTVERAMTDDEEKAAVRDASISPEYSKLKNKPDTYKGRTVRYEGYVTDVRKGSGEWIISFATKKSNDNYSSIIMVMSDKDVDYAEGTRLTLYGMADGTYMAEGADDNNLVYPKVKLSFFDEANK